MILYCILGFILTSITGSLLHFVYDWLKHNKYASLFVAVNESVWEHLKLAILPIFVWNIIGLMFGFNNYAFACFITILTIIVIIPTIFYGYTHFTKKPILVIDISSFFIAIGLGIIFSYLIMNANEFGSLFKYVGIVGMFLFTIMIFTFTYYPPKLFLFRDPVTKKYGRAGHGDDKNFNNNKNNKSKKTKIDKKN